MDSQRLSTLDSHRFNLTKGDILGKMLMVSLPLIGTQLMLMGYNLVDMFLLGRLGGWAVAASGSAGMYLWLSNGLMLIGRMGAEIGVAQRKGARDQAGALLYSRRSLALAAALGVLSAAVCALFPAHLIAFLNIREPDVAAAAARYLYIVGFGMPAVFVSSSIAGTFTGAGNSRTPFTINALGLLLNAILDPIFIFPLEMGIEGAAIATVIAQVLACALSIHLLARGKARPFPRYGSPTEPGPVGGGTVAAILRWTLPISIESMLFTIFAMIVARYVAEYGASALTVARVGSQIESLCWLVCLGFSSGITAFVGQNHGAGQWRRIQSGIRLALVALSAWGVCVTTLFFWAGREVVGLFVPEETIMDMGAEYLWILAFSQIFFCLESVAAGAFRGMGRTLPPSIVSVITNGVRIPMAYFMSQTSLGLNGIWITISLCASLRGLWVFVWFLRANRSGSLERGRQT